ncbi:MAG: hypothetical protein NVS3B7_10880 [Candidatus Elarobacter sp.]
MLSRIGKARKRALIDIGKAGPRTAMQVLANGGIATVCAVTWAATHEPRWVWAFAGAYAAATADTWATEIGTLVRGRPRSIFTLRPIATGLSGGITFAGTLAEIGGAAWLAAVTVAACPYALAAVSSLPRAGTVLALAGVAGATFDSLLGGSIQELRRCDACNRRCETDPHACGSPARLVRGVSGVTNDAVNVAATLAGAIVAGALA